MADNKKSEKGKKTPQTPFVYGLDIGTRSVVGTVGYPEKDGFVVMAQVSVEHESRSMIDGQIHDIAAVGETIRQVTAALEKKTGETLKSVCIAAAGRVLKTVETHVEMQFEEEKTITREDIFALDSLGVEKSYETFAEENRTDLRFYCVGYTIMKYYLNNYPMTNLENHKARSIEADLIATFLPDEVVDGLYKAVEMAGLEVANLTLEPIAAMEVAIPTNYRMLNIALIDVGAGTSDISITKDGSITAYGMLPIAGDMLTEEIARHCLVDFAMAEHIKRGIGEQEKVEYKDIMGLPQKITRKEVLDTLQPKIEELATQAADKIMELNGDKPVSAVFVVGGGGKIAGYTEAVADRLGIAKERCALRGEEVMGKIRFQQKDIVKDSLLVTPIGICLNFYQQSNNFIFVTFNGERIKLYDNNHLAVVDACLGAGYANEDLFPKRGTPLTFMLNGKQKVIRGGLGESCQISLNNKPTDINAPIHSNDVIQVKPSTKGDPGTLTLDRIPETKETITIQVNGERVTLPKFASVNGKMETGTYKIAENDNVEILPYYTVAQVAEVMDITPDPAMDISINHEKCSLDGKVYDNFTLEMSFSVARPIDFQEYVMKDGDEPDSDFDQNTYEKEDSVGTTEQTEQIDWTAQTDTQRINVQANDQKADDQSNAKGNTQKTNVQGNYQNAGGQGNTQKTHVQDNDQNAGGQGNTQKTHVQDDDQNAGGQGSPQRTNVQGENKNANSADAQDSDTPPAPEQKKVIRSMGVIVNGHGIVLQGKSDYVYVDVFDYIDFDLSKPQGKTVETLLNGRKAQYMEPLKSGDVISIAWKN